MKGIITWSIFYRWYFNQTLSIYVTDFPYKTWQNKEKQVSKLNLWKIKKFKIWLNLVLKNRRWVDGTGGFAENIGQGGPPSKKFISTYLILKRGRPITLPRRPHTNLRRLHRSKKNHRKIFVIGQIIGSGKIDSFMWIESII